MNSALTAFIERFAGLHVAVIGDVMLDSYLHGRADTVCREAPVPVVTVEARSYAPGGAANTAANLRSLGAQVSLLAIAGADSEGKILQHELAARGIATAQLLVDPQRATLAKQRLVAGAQMLVRFDQGSTAPIDPASEQALIEKLTAIFPRIDALVISDYGYGVVTPRVIAALTALQARWPRIITADSKRLRALRDIGLTAIKPNYGEVTRLLGTELFEGRARLAAVGAHGARLLDEINTRIAAVTLDSDGALVFEAGRPTYRTYARPADATRATGAGDTFISALTLALAAGADTAAAAELAALAANVVVARDGTVTCTAAELDEQLTGAGKLVHDVARLNERLAPQRHNRRIVFTNGCFDLLHREHIALLNHARLLGDILIVGINTDASVRRLKGPGRPLISLEDRLQILAALSCVDYLVPFDDDTPVELIRAIKPDVFVKGANYSADQLPEAALVTELGGRVQLVPYLEEHSTNSLIERIRTGGEQVRAVGG